MPTWLQLVGHDEPVLLVGDQQGPRGEARVSETLQPQRGLLQHGLGAGEDEQLLGMALPRSGPQPGPGPSGENDGLDDGIVHFHGRTPCHRSTKAARRRGRRQRLLYRQILGGSRAAAGPRWQRRSHRPLGAGQAPSPLRGGGARGVLSSFHGWRTLPRLSASGDPGDRQASTPVSGCGVPGSPLRRYLYDILDEFIARGGKRARPAMAMLACEAVGGEPQQGAVGGLRHRVLPRRRAHPRRHHGRESPAPRPEVRAHRPRRAPGHQRRRLRARAGVHHRGARPGLWTTPRSWPSSTSSGR